MAAVEQEGRSTNPPKDVPRRSMPAQCEAYSSRLNNRFRWPSGRSWIGLGLGLEVICLDSIRFDSIWSWFGGSIRGSVVSFRFASFSFR